MVLGPSYSWCDFNVTETSSSVHAWVIRKLRNVAFLPLLHMNEQFVTIFIVRHFHARSNILLLTSSRANRNYYLATSTCRLRANRKLLSRSFLHDPSYRKVRIPVSPTYIAWLVKINIESFT